MSRSGATSRAPWQGDYVTKVTGTAPDRGCACPQWLAFLYRIFAGDTLLIGYVQRVLGYALTGLTTEQILLFGYGTGANGKSVLIETVSGIMGDYAKSARFEEELTIEVRVERIGRTSIRFGFTVLRAEEELARGQITAVLCRVRDDHSLEAMAFPDDLREQILAGPS